VSFRRRAHPFTSLLHRLSVHARAHCSNTLMLVDFSYDSAQPLLILQTSNRDTAHAQQPSTATLGVLCPSFFLPLSSLHQLSAHSLLLPLLCYYQRIAKKAVCPPPQRRLAPSPLFPTSTHYLFNSVRAQPFFFIIQTYRADKATGKLYELRVISSLCSTFYLIYHYITIES
jgi:hypothetical protein